MNNMLYTTIIKSTRKIKRPISFSSSLLLCKHHTNKLNIIIPALFGNNHTIPISTTKQQHSFFSTDVQEATHEVFNQVQDFENYNAVNDPALREGLERSGCTSWNAMKDIDTFGKSCGNPIWLAKAKHANKYPPVIQTHSRTGERVDTVEYQPTYHDLIGHGLNAGAAAYAWQNEGQIGAHVARGSMLYLQYQLESGVCCPITMTFASVPALRTTPSIGDKWVPKVTSGIYDGRNIPMEEKDGCTIGMSMTEKQGGSDVRANTTFATPIDNNQNGEGDMFTLVGHKWFTSAPMSDGFLTLAQTGDNELSCFLVPRWLPDGTRNKGFQIMRLKDKLGDKSNASSEVEYRNAVGFMVGKPGRGVPTILEMVVHTRLDCTIASAGLMRHAAHQAVHHTSQRKAFGGYLIDQPVMKSVLTDLGVESEAAIATWVRLAQAFDDKESEEEQNFRRIATAVSKYWICKRAPAMVYESMECFGGNGYVEEGPMARIFRQSPLNSIWEGSGNVISLDIVRALHSSPKVSESIINEFEKARGMNKYYDIMLDNVKDEILKPMEVGPRCLADHLALTLQGGLLLRYGESNVADTFCKLRLDPSTLSSGWNFGAWGTNLISNEAQSVVVDRMRL